jgi:hypothetical protein
VTAYIHTPYVLDGGRTAPVGTASAKRVDSTGARPHYSLLQVRGFGDQRRLLVLYTHHENAAGTRTVEPDALTKANYPIWVSVRRFNVEYFPKGESK